MRIPPASLSALRFLHESGGWLDSDPPECKVHRTILHHFEKRGWVECDRNEGGDITGCVITKAGHEAYQAAAEGGKPSPDCHGCSFHYAEMARAAS